MCVGGRVKKRPLVPRNHAPVPAWLARVQCLFYLPLPPDRQTDRETHGLSRGRPKVVVWRANTQPPRPPTPQRRPHTHPSGRKPMPQTNPHTPPPTRIPPPLPPPPPPCKCVCYLWEGHIVPKAATGGRYLQEEGRGTWEGARNPLQTSSSHLSPGKRCGATAQSALGWYRPSVGVPETLDGRPSGVLV